MIFEKKKFYSYSFIKYLTVPLQVLLSQSSQVEPSKPDDLGIASWL